MRNLKAAVNSAVGEICRVASAGPCEVLPKELQLTAAMYRHFSDLNYLVHVEAGYPMAPRNGIECDLRVCGNRGTTERWIEIKRIWNAPPFVPKIPEHIESLERDIDRLLRMAPANARKYAVAFIFSGESPRRRVELMPALEKILPGNPRFKIASRPMTWRNSGISSVSAWGWEVLRPDRKF